MIREFTVFMPYNSKKNMIKTITLESGDVLICNWNTIGHMAGWIETLFTASKNLKNCGIVSALVLTPDDKIFNHGTFLLPNIYIPASYAMKEKFYGQYAGTREVETTHLICGIVKKALVAKLPLPADFGENPFVDADYCLEARKLGFKIYATSELIVQYKGPVTDESDFKKYSFDFEGAYQKFRAKWGRMIDKRYKLPVMFQTSVGAPSGFAAVARGYMKGLSENGIKVCYNFLKGTNDEEPMSEDQLVDTLAEDHGDLMMPQIIWAQAPYFNKNSGIYKIGHCEFEGEMLPEEWSRQCNLMDEIWVPTNWDRQKFRRNGVNVPIYTIPQGLDPNYFNPEIAPARFEVQEKFKFLCVAAWDPRKNLPNLITAFQNEFTDKDDVCLIVKTCNLGLTASIEKEVKRLKAPKGSAKVYIDERIVPQEELGCIYTAADAFVLATHGEAWGLPVFEALACGLPVITTGYGAPKEVLSDKDGKELPGVHFIRHQKTVTDTPYVYLQGNYWAEPSILHLQELMRQVYENSAAEKISAAKTGEWVRKTFDWKSVTLPIKERIEDIYKTKIGGALSKAGK